MSRYLLLVALLGACGVGPAPARAASITPPWGFHDYLWGLQAPPGPVATDPLVQSTSADGASIDRLIVGWSWIEQQKGVYDWSTVDPAYRAMAARGIQPVVTVYAAPGWATEGGLSCTGCAFRPDPAHYPDWQNFLQVLMKHLQSLDRAYSGFPGAKALEVWNEPNLRRFFYPAPDAGAFVQLLKRARQAAKATGFKKPIVSGGLASNTTAVDGQRATADVYLQQMYAQKFQSYVDGIGIHPHPKGSTDLATDMDTAPYYGVDTLDAIRRANKDSHPFWITETGVSSIPCSVPDCSGPNDPRAGVDGAAAQGDALVSMYRSLATRPVAAFIIYDFETNDTPGSSFAGYGVVDTSTGSIVPKQSYCVLGAQIGNGAPAGC